MASLKYNRFQILNLNFFVKIMFCITGWLGGVTNVYSVYLVYSEYRFNLRGKRNGQGRCQQTSQQPILNCAI